MGKSYWCVSFFVGYMSKFAKGINPKNNFKKNMYNFFLNFHRVNFHSVSSISCPSLKLLTVVFEISSFQC